MLRTLYRARLSSYDLYIDCMHDMNGVRPKCLNLLLHVE